MEEPSGEHGGIGLQNVISRLCLLYKDDRVFEINSEGLGRGTTVTIRIPIPVETQEENDAPDAVQITSQES